ncbi:hypothetical protein L6R52_27505 [Myxococcota bacterium]|nr:hypothetical protein [Myxococcota bacterium]
MTIQRDDFLRRFGTGLIDLARVREDASAQATLREAGISVSDLARADVDGDGLVDAREAWRLADSFDRNGSSTSLVARDPATGTETRAGTTVRVSELLAHHPGASRANPRAPNDPALRPGGNTATRSAPKPNDEILHVGMNQHAHDEVKHLRSRGARVTSISDSTAGDDQIRAGGRTHDLTNDAGIDGFTATLGLPAEQQKKIGDAIRSAGPDGRDELAGIAQVWARGERGESVPSRMVLSGHHVGSAVWGDGNGEISWDSLKQLSDAMPKAAAQVEDLHIAACYSGGAQAEAKYKEIFPNARTIWSYSGSAPGTWSGAMSHLSSWETATRGRGTDVAGAAQRLVDRGVRKAENIDARAIDATRTTVPLADLRARHDALEGAFEPAFLGEQRITDSQRGPLRDYYGAVQNLLQHPDLPAGDRQNLEARRDQTIRTLFYESNVRGRFQETHGATVGAGFEALGLERPDFSKLTRAEAIAAIRAYRVRLDEQPNPPAAATNALELLNGLWNLDPRTIPQAWI